MHDIIILVMRLVSLLPYEDQRAALAFIEDPPCSDMHAPAILHPYDPALGGINCDDDCSTVATGALLPEMYERAGACDKSMLGSTVYFDDIGMSMECVDTGGLIGPGWSERDSMCVMYFDVLWHLDIEGGKITNAPSWNHWLLPNWRTAWNK